MKTAPTPWVATHDGHGGICLDDADGRQIGLVSARPEQKAHAALLRAAPALFAALQAQEVLDSGSGMFRTTDEVQKMRRAAIALALGAA